jgi:hypothetical protein
MFGSSKIPSIANTVTIAHTVPIATAIHYCPINREIE